MNQKQKQFYTYYTFIFIGTALLVFSFFVISGKSFIWANDGLYQHYNAFVYLGQWVRSIFNTLWTQHKLVIPMWEFSIGYGADVFTTLSYYVLGDPFALISVFTPGSLAEVGYAIAILLRFYAAGLAFCAFAHYMKCQRFSSLCGAVMYVFSSYALFAGVRHPYFINPMIYLPLLFLGVEKILQKQSPLIFIITVFIAAISNFYFFYMLVLLTILYAGVRLFTGKEWGNVKQRFQYLLQLGGFALIGVAMAAVLLLPNGINFLDNTRVSGAYSFGMFYARSEYEALPGSLVGINSAVNWAVIGMAPLAYLGAGAALLNRRENRWAKYYLGLFILFLLFPFAGHVFNGFGYVCNRWVFAWSFMVAFLFAKGFPLLLTMNRRKKLGVSAGCVGYVAVCILLEKSRTEDVLVGCLLLLICLLLIWSFDFLKPLQYKTITFTKQELCRILTLGMVLICVFQSAYYRYSSAEKNYVKEFHDRGTANVTLNQQRASALKRIQNEDFYRVENADQDNAQVNFSLSSGVSTTTLYWSIVNPHIVSFLQYNNAYAGNTYCFRNLQCRSLLLPLASTRYFVTSYHKKAMASVPYGYCFKGDASSPFGTFRLYETKQTLPFGYTYDSVLPFEQYEAMSVAQRQQAMLQSAILAPEHEDAIHSLPKGNPVYTDKTLSFSVKCGENTRLEGDNLIVAANHATITLECECPANSELYVQLQNLRFESKSTQEFWNREAWNGKTSYEKLNAKRSSKYWTPAKETTITGSCNGVYDSVTHYTKQNIYAHGRENYWLNLCYADKTRTQITLQFSQKGIYDIQGLSVLCQPMQPFEQQLYSLREDTLESVTFSQNRIEGSIQVDKPKLLCLSLPYSKGWKAYVDGQPAELLRTNVMYSGIILQAGSHTIEMHYETPYLLAGAGISVLGFVGLLILIIVRKKGRNYHG